MPNPLVDAATPIRVGVLLSQSDSRLRYLLEEDPNYGTKYEIAVGFANYDDSDAIELLEEHGIPVECNDIHDFYAEREADLPDMAVRQEFDSETAAVLSGYDLDLVALAGYIHIVTEPLLDAFSPQMVNLHHADLTITDGSGQPIYDGLHSVRDAIRDGESATRETAHVVTREVDAGPPLVRSTAFPVHEELTEDVLEREATDVTKAYVYAHREWQIRVGGGRTLAKTLKLIADGRIALDGDEVYVDGKRGFYQLNEGVRELASVH